MAFVIFIILAEIKIFIIIIYNVDLKNWWKFEFNSIVRPDIWPVYFGLNIRPNAMARA